MPKRGVRSVVKWRYNDFPFCNKPPAQSFPIPSVARFINNQTWESSKCSDVSYEKEFAVNSFGLQELKSY